MSYPNYVFSIFAFVGFVLSFIPFPWHLEAWNTGTCLYMLWTGLGCLVLFINSIVWNNDAINRAPVWCDITSRFITGLTIAVPACSLCINRRLYHIASVRSVTITKAEKRRQVTVDLAIGLGIPALYMIFQYIPQGHRFNIFQEIGCFPYTYNTWVAYLLVFCPPLVVSVSAALYSFGTIYSLWKTRCQTHEMLSSYSNLNSSRYFRLMFLASLEVWISIPLISYNIYFVTKSGVRPWISWADTHSGFSRVDQFPSILWRSAPAAVSNFERYRWSTVSCALIFFAFFGFADEARKHYRIAYQSIAKHVSSSFGTSTINASKGGVSSQNGSIPTFTVEKLQRKDSFSSFSEKSVSFKDAGSYLDSKSSDSTLNEKKDDSSKKNKKSKHNDAIFRSSFAYDGLVLPDVGGCLSSSDSSSSSDLSPESSPPSSSASSITVPEPAITRTESRDIEVSSLRRASRLTIPDINIYEAPTSDSADPRRHSHDMV